jgi:hypothetical protein
MVATARTEIAGGGGSARGGRAGPGVECTQVGTSVCCVLRVACSRPCPPPPPNPYPVVLSCWVGLGWCGFQTPRAGDVVLVAPCGAWAVV